MITAEEVRKKAHELIEAQTDTLYILSKLKMYQASIV